MECFKLRSFSAFALIIALPLLLAACGGSTPTLGNAKGHTVSGGAGGGEAEGENDALEKCDETLGTMSVFEDTSLPWWQMYRSRMPNLGSTIPVIRLMIQQSNCFVIVERGAAFKAMERERELMSSGESRAGSNFGKGQIVAADYTLSPSVQFNQQTGGIGAAVGGLFGGIGSLIAGGMKKNEAATNLLLIDNRSGVQVSASVGNATKTNFGMMGGLFGGGAGAAVGGFSNTPEGKLLTAAFVDSYNNMVKSLRNYKAQQVKGGLGKGGQLKVGQ